MPTKSLRIVRPGRYGTRDLKADDIYEATGPEARLYLKLGWMAENTRARVADAPGTRNPPKKAPAKRKAKKKA